MYEAMNRSITKDAIDLREIFRNSLHMKSKLGYAIALGIGFLLMLSTHREVFIEPFEQYDSALLEYLQP